MYILSVHPNDASLRAESLLSFHTLITSYSENLAVSKSLKQFNYEHVKF